ncbi:MAG: hypothetical protein AAFX99_26625 [Myxococcota bacterium]
MKSKMASDTLSKGFWAQLFAVGLVVAFGALYGGCNTLGEGDNQRCAEGDNCTSSSSERINASAAEHPPINPTPTHRAT